MLRFSVHTQPQIVIGRVVMKTQNMAEGPDRIRYLEGMINFLNDALEEVQASQTTPSSTVPENIQKLLQQLPFCSDLVDVFQDERGKWVAREHSAARDSLSFNLNRLAVTFVDGRLRSAKDKVRIPTAESTPAFSRIVSALYQGASNSELATLANQENIEIDGILRRLMERGFVEEVAQGETRVNPRFTSEQGDKLTWLGHATMMFQSGGSTILVDPYIPPKLVWKKEEYSDIFSNSYADSKLFEPYGPTTQNLSIQELPVPDAVLITHQDSDHIDVGVLMTLPEHVTIIVPKLQPRRRGSPGSPDRPWEVDLSQMITTVLGPHRKVVALGHGESIQFGSIKVTAFPFRGEMPKRLDHSWNCYLMETDRSAVICTADARVSDDEIDFLVKELSANPRPVTLLSGIPYSAPRMLPGIRENVTMLYNNARLYSWYIPLASLFDPYQGACITYPQITRLAKEANLRYFFPYARGSAPWHRIRDLSDSFYPIISSMSTATLDEIVGRLGELDPNVRLFPGKYGQPTPVD